MNLRLEIPKSRPDEIVREDPQAFKEKYPVMWIVCGAIVGKNQNGKLCGRVAIPDTLFKAILATKRG